MSKEIWRFVIGFQGTYEVSDLGNVRSYRKRHTGGLSSVPKLLVGGIYRRNDHYFQPYRYVILTTNTGKVIDRKIGRLVLEAFMGPRPVGHEVSHLNGNPTDDRIDNLDWETPIENMARRTPGYIRGGKYTAEDVKKEIKTRRCYKQELV